MRFGLLLKSLVKRMRELWLRIVLMGGIQVANMVLAYFLLPAQYGAVAMAAFILKNCHQGTLGLTQGYIFAHYNNEDDHLGSYALAFVLLGLAYFGISAFALDSVLVLAGLPFIALFLIEPYLRVKRNFGAIFVPEFIFLVSVILIIPLIGQIDKGTVAPVLGGLSLLFSLAYVMILRRGDLSGFANSFRRSDKTLSGALILMRNGVQAYVSTLLAFVVLVIDRKFILSLYGEDELGVFMLAFQACLVITLVSSLFNATSIVDVGTLMRNNPDRVVGHLRKRYAITLAANTFLWVVVVMFLVIIADTLFPNFEGLTTVTALVGASIVIQAAFYSVSPFLFFKRRQTVVNIVLIGVLLLKAAAYLGLNGTGLSWVEMVALQSGILIVGMLYCTIYLYVVVAGNGGRYEVAAVPTE